MKTLAIIFITLLIYAFFRRRVRFSRRQPYRKGEFNGRGSYQYSGTAKEKGTLFEDFVADLLADDRLILLERTQDRVSSRGVYAEACRNPDLHVRQIYGRGYIDYYLECKFKSHRNADGSIEFDDYKIARYHRFQREKRRKVFLAVGIGSNPSAPKEFMILPLDSLCGNSLPPDAAEFRLRPTPDNLIAYMDSYFSYLFSGC